MDPKNMTDSELNAALGDAYVTKARATKNYEAVQREWFKRHGTEVGHEVDMAGVRVELQPNRRFNADQARRVLPVDRLREIMRPQVDAALAKEVLTPEEYLSCMKDGNNPKMGVSLGFNV